MAKVEADPATSIESTLKEKRVFRPPKAFSAKAHIKSMAQYERMYRESVRNPEKFWGRVAEELEWFKKWRQVMQWKLPFAKWFVGGKTNICYNCLDRHLDTPRKNKAALIWEGEPGEVRTLTYQQLHHEVCKFANVLKILEIKKGDRVVIYMGMVPELPIAMLACARIGAVHSVVFGGFSADALRDRTNDAQAVAVITQDGAFRRGTEIRLKSSVDEALKEAPSVRNVIVFRRSGTQVNMEPGRDHWWHELVKAAPEKCPAEPLDSEHILFTLYTSGTTGKPKGVVHTTGGYMVYVYLTTKYVFDLTDEDTYWCTADIGWVTGHSYILYGPLLNGATSLMYEGAPNYPNPDRFWEIVERHKVNIFYTAPTAIRAFTKWGDEWPKKHDLSSLRLLGTVGEPINPEAWMWYQRNIGKGRCPIVDTWWQTETGGILITPLPGATPTKPGTATRPFFGIVPDVVDRAGNPVPANTGGYLVIREPWPAMLRTIWGDDERYRRQYWSEIEGLYFSGDGARKDKDGYYWIMGRVDDVINVGGHRLGTMEVESALVSHDKVAEAAVVGRPDELKGQAIVAFVTLEGAYSPSENLREELRQHVVKEIGPIAKPDDLRFTDSLPKTRSGKIMRRLLREIAAGGAIKGDVTTLEDLSVLEKLREAEE
ncbi:MAG: acetate--CoA ligase [Acidobacteria bacterium]|nr:MAG: acetate--CoA ligase [Acidobacteriota bacterium]